MKLLFLSGLFMFWNVNLFHAGQVIPGTNINIAFNKPTKQYPGTYCEPSNICHNSSRAVDGFTNQNVSSGNCSHTSSGQNAWWAVDFKGAYHLSKIRIFNRASIYYNQRLEGFNIRGSPDNKVIFQDGYNSSVYLKSTIDVPIPITFSNYAFTGINISIPGEFLTLCEVQVYLGIYNIAFGKPTTQFPGTYNRHNASLAVNGETNSSVNSGYCSHTLDGNANGGAWWTVDFQEFFFLSTILIFNRDDGGFGENLRRRLEGFSVYGLPNYVYLYKDGTEQTLYNDEVIRLSIPVEHSKERFSGINISIPHHVETFLTLCEVEVFLTGYCKLPSIKNGTFTWQNGSIMPDVIHAGQTFTYRCNEGFTKRSDETLLCNSDNVIDGPDSPECKAIECPIDVNMARNYTVSSTAVAYKYGSEWKAVCKMGFELVSGSLTRSCQANGTWSGEEPFCQIVSCALPAADPKLKLFPLPNAVYGSVLQSRCRKGYQLQSGNLNRTCLANGSFSGSKPVCEVVTCLIDVNMEGNYTVPNKSATYTYGTEWTAICKKGFRLASGNLTRNCQADGRWSGQTPYCKLVSCAMPRSDSAINVLPLFHAVYGSVFESSCKHGFKLRSGDLNRTCLESGFWSGSEPVCEEIMCSSPNDIANGQYFLHRSGDIKEDSRRISNQRTFSVNTTLSVKCNSGYMLQNNSMIYRYCKDDTHWSNMDPECIAIERTSSKDTAASDNAGVIGGSVGGVCAVLVAVFVVIFVIRRKRWNFSNHGESQKTKMKAFRDRTAHYENPIRIETHDDSGYSEVQDISCVALRNASPTSVKEETDMSQVEIEHNDNQHNYYNFDAVEKRSPSAIMLEDLGNYVMPGKVTMAKLEAQYSNLPTGLLHNHNAALKPENARKNRYRGIYAFDDNRVVLEKGQQKADTDYVNASYINGFDSARAYIASQGTTKDTLGDFWRMVWQVNCSKIVMLTNLREENKMKCIQYWPDVGNQLFGEFTVRLSEAESFSDFVLRTLEIKKASSNVRIVHQFHFTAWPDRGVPKFSSSLVNFRNKVRRTKTTGKGPIVVHCSAGIGRTGTYIALDILAEQGKVLGYVDIAGCVTTLRQQRVNMVQNPDQYVFLHTALTEALMLSSSATSAATFQDSYRELLQFDTVQRKRNIEVAFDMLKHMSPVPDETQYVSAREVRNKRKNRYSNILPVSECMPVIFGSGNDGYINAVYLPSYKERKALILTQMPLKNTKEDFWALVQEHDVHTIVMLNTIEEVEKDEIYWPEVGESQTFNDNEVECIGEESIGQHSLLELQMSKGKTDRTVEQVQCKYWPASEALPSSPSDIITTIELVQTLQQKSGNHPIVVHCMNGVDRSGLFCVLWAVIERLRIEQDVAISQVIEQMRSCRDQLIPSVEQFQFCHEVIQIYIEQFSEYSNFSAI